MKFQLICELFENLGKTSKRLQKILLLRDFYNLNKKEALLIFDLISGNYQRKIDKRSIGISLKTVFSVISFVSKKSEREVEKYFNKVGDIGEVALHFLDENKQTSFLSNSLDLNHITTSFEKIANTSGNNKNKIKKEILSKLFLSANSNLEYKFLARLLIDDLRVGVSEGVLKEALVNSIFPQILEINLICSKCNYINLNTKNCIKCSEILSEKEQEEIVSKKFEILEVDTPEEFIGLENFIGERSEIERLKFILRIDKNKYFVKTKDPRILYNLFLSLFEKYYNLRNSFIDTLKDIDSDLTNLVEPKINLGTPIKSMLGTRANTVEDSFKISDKPAVLDFKYDGLRVQIHNNKGEVQLFSRNLDNITKQFPEVVEFIKINFSDISFVVDSECVGFDFDKMQFLPFQLLSRRILTKDVNSVSHIKVTCKAFDLLYLNGETLIDKSYEKRRELLENLFVGKELIQELNFDISSLKILKN